MQKKIKIMAISAIIALALTLPLSAQGYVASRTGPRSNQMDATAGIFGADVDNFLAPHFFRSVNFENGFGAVVGRTTDIANNPFHLGLGYATRLGEDDGLYIGAWYHGNLFSIVDNTTTSSIWASRNANNQVIQTIETLSTSGGWRHTTNQLDVLFGLQNNMGIRVGFFQSLAVQTNPLNTFTTVDHLDGRREYTNRVVDFDRRQGYMTPSVEWGMNMAQESGMVIRPWAVATLNIYQDRNFMRRATYETNNGQLVGNKDFNITGADGGALGWDRGHLRPDLLLGVRFDSPRENAPGSIRYQVTYNVNFRLHNNDFGKTGFSGTAGGPVTWSGVTDTTTNTIATTEREREATLNFQDTTQVNNTLTLLYRFISGPADGFRFGFMASLPIDFNFGRLDVHGVEHSVTTTTDNATGNVYEIRERTVTHDGLTETNVFALRPALSIATTAVVGNTGRFTVNGGIVVNPFSFTNTTVTTSSNGFTSIDYHQEFVNGQLTYQSVTPSDTPAGTDSVARTTAWGNINGSVSGGFVFNFSDNAAVDLLAGTSWSAAAFNAGMFLNLTTVNVQFTFRY